MLRDYAKVGPRMEIPVCAGFEIFFHACSGPRIRVWVKVRFYIRVRVRVKVRNVLGDSDTNCRVGSCWTIVSAPAGWRPVER